MFGRTKKKIVDSIKEEATNQFYESAESGRIRTGSVVVEALIFIGLLIAGRGGSTNSTSNANEIHIHIHE